MTEVRDAIQWAGNVLLKEGFETPATEVEAILGGLLNVTSVQIHLNPQRKLSPGMNILFRDFIFRRSRREPVAYLLGQKNFYGRDFKVSSSVLIPRPETELLVERVLKAVIPAEAGTQSTDDFNAIAAWIPASAGMTKILEIGTGSGCIAVTLACEKRNISVVATDLSKEALAMAKTNANGFGVGEKIQFIQSDLYSALGPQLRGDFDIIVSNPPYIPSSVIDQLDPDLRFEPRLALDGGEDGIFLLKPLIQGATEFLRTSGLLALEIGYDQGKKVARLLEDSGFSEIEIIKDLNRHDRIATGRFRGSI